MRTSALSGAINSDFFKLKMCPHKQEEVELVHTFCRQERRDQGLLWTAP